MASPGPLLPLVTMLNPPVAQNDPARQLSYVYSACGPYRLYRSEDAGPFTIPADANYNLFGPGAFRHAKIANHKDIYMPVEKTHCGKFGTGPY